MSKKKDLIKATAIIVAAGSGTRMKLPLNKQFILIDDIPVLAHTLLKFQSARTVDEIIVVTRQDLILTAWDLVREYALSKVKHIIPGGDSRQDSVKCGLDAAGNADIIAVHDGARPFVESEKIDEAIHAAVKYGAAALGVPLKDTVKIADKNDYILQTPDRSTLRLIQTPQVFRSDLIKEAYRYAEQTHFTGTDDCSLLEHMDIPVKIIDGDYNNIKITTAEDLPIAEAIYRSLG